MGSSTRHWTIATSPAQWAAAVSQSPRPLPKGGYATGVREEMAHRLVHRVLREQEIYIRSERCKPWPVADQRPSSPVGQRSPASNVVALQRKGGLPNQQGGS